MVSGKDIFIEGETLYEAGRVTEAFEFYRQAIVQILEHEDVLQKFPGIPEQFPQEVLASVWQNFLRCFKTDGGGFTQEAYPVAYDLVYSFRPTSSARTHHQFKGPQGRRLLKAMQISAAFTLGILAWGQGDRSTTAKRYQEALDIAATHPPFNADHRSGGPTDEEEPGDPYQGDSNTARMLGSGQGVLRKEVLNAPLTRVGDDGTIMQQDTFVVATDACGRIGCNKRGVNFKRCADVRRLHIVASNVRKKIGRNTSRPTFKKSTFQCVAPKHSDNPSMEL
ncbi:hypothetical protein B0H13DRAFT_2282109 [Mycena leptocephala]|nr:hypothetical protein B0H13DRAFT_2282109 [Mycena leptocephala]